MDSVTKTDQLKVVVFRIGNEEFSLPIEEVVSIERMQEITSVPKMPDYVKGITTIRGTVTPVIDLRKVLNAKDEESEHCRLILIKLEDKSIGLIVDSATDVLDIPESSIQKPNLPEVQSGYLIGVSKINNRLILLINTQILLENLNDFNHLKESLHKI